MSNMENCSVPITHVKIVELYKNLILNLDEINNYDFNYKDNEPGNPNASTSTIALIYALVKKNKNLINVNSDKLFECLINCAKNNLILYDEDCVDNNGSISINEHKLNDWDDIKKSNMNYYYSNDAYDLGGVSNNQIKELLKMLSGLKKT